LKEVYKTDPADETYKDRVKLLINHIQNHVCVEGYCLKNNRACRFKFPKDL